MKVQTVAIATVAVSLLAVTAAFAGNQRFNFSHGVQDMNNTAAQDAIASADYGSWKEAMLESYSATLTEDRFNKEVEMYQSRKTVQDALDSGDYTAWKDAVDSKGLTSLITEDNFDAYVQFQNALQSGDMDTAMQLGDELGIGMESGMGHGFGRGMERMGRFAMGA
jgi:murein L,D-transpeptidase YafK